MPLKYLRVNPDSRDVVERVNYLVNRTAPASNYYNAQIDFGVKFDGTDTTAEMQAAINASYGGTLYVGPGKVAISNLSIVKPITIIGAGMNDFLHSDVESTYTGSTRFVPVSGSTGYMFNIGIEAEPAVSATVRNHENQNFGVVFRDFAIDGVDRVQDIGGILIRRLDHSLFMNLNIIRVKRQALYFQATVREMTCFNVYTRYCGNESTYPAIDLYDDDSGYDSHNNIFFTNCFFIFSMGDTIRIDTDQIGTSVRRIHFTSCMIHGIVLQLDGSPYTYTAGQKAGRLVQIKGGEDIKFVNVRFHAAGLDVPNVTIDDSTSGNTPETVMFSQCEFNDHYSGSTIRKGLHVKTGSAIYSGCVFRGHSEASYEVDAGAVLHDGGGNVILTGAGGIINGEHKTLQYSYQNFQDDVFIKADKKLSVSIIDPAATALYFKDLSGNNVAQIDTDNLFKIESAAWDSKHLKIGNNHLWKDDVNIWRTKSTAPAAARDGIAIQDDYAAVSITTTGTTTVAYDGQNVLVFAPASALTVTDFTATYENNGTVLWLKFSNANTTIQYNADIILNGAIDVTPAANNLITVKRIEGKWYEVSRNF